MKNLHTAFESKILKHAKTIDYMCSETPFYATRSLFRAAVGYEPLSYEEWLSIDDQYKAAALYVTFFDQITLAWSKAKSFYVHDEDGVSEMMKYLVKNTPIIAASKKKYSPAYIYKVAYNCLYCISRDIKRDRLAYENNVPQYVQHGDDFLDLFDTVCDPEDITKLINKKTFWNKVDNVVENAAWDVKAMMNKIMQGGSLPAGIPMKRRADIMEELKATFAAYKSMFYDEAEQSDDDKTLTFADILRNDDNIASAVVELPNGESAVYYGQKWYNAEGKISKIEFFGPTKDYLVPAKQALTFKVTDVELYK